MPLMSTSQDRRTRQGRFFFLKFLAIGFLAVNIRLPVGAIIGGAIVGLLVSLPDAIITKAYAPILITGVVFGALAGWAARTWAL